MLKPFDLQGLFIFLCIKVALVTDPCMGSGHILVYLFDVLMQIYESQGWTQREAAQSIVQNNLYGLDIDDRAAQLAYFAVMMKARQYDRRFLERGIIPHVYGIQESNGIKREHIKLFGNGMSLLEKNSAINQLNEMLDVLWDAKEYGSIIDMPVLDWDLLNQYTDGIDTSNQITLDSVGIDDTLELVRSLVKQAQVLSQKYSITVTNPPYMGGRNLEEKCLNYISEQFSDGKADLFSVFILRNISFLNSFGYMGLITQQSWMFLPSFESVRKHLLDGRLVGTVHLGAHAFEEIGGEIVQTCSFVWNKQHIDGFRGHYKRLTNGNANDKKDMFFDTKNDFCINQDSFYQIPGAPISYWIGESVYKAYSNPKLGDLAKPRQGMATSDNNRFLRLWYEVSIKRFEPSCHSLEESITLKKKWYPYNKGGANRRWYGNFDYVVNWENNGKEVREYAASLYKSESRTIKNVAFYFRKSITWSLTNSNDFGARIRPVGSIFDVNGMSLFIDDDTLYYYYLALLCSKPAVLFMQINNPTLANQAGDVARIPVALYRDYIDKVDSLAEENIELSKQDWDSFETSWDFHYHPMIYNLQLKVEYADSQWSADRLKKCSSLSWLYKKWESECEYRFKQLKANEEELNRIFIDIYGLQDELTPEVSDNDVTVRKADLGRDIRSLISYAVGCMLGRYSLDVDGLAYAGGDWDDSKYKTYLPDPDNCIPITDEPYFEDDIVGRFVSFIRTVYGEETLEENLDFIAKALGNKGNTSREVIRNYFLNDFIKDHIRIYQKRPIYWLFDSGKQNGFKALVYMHRWNADTVGNLRVEYLHRMQRVYEKEIERMQDIIDNSRDNREVNQASKRREKLVKQLKEARDYDAKIAHVALSRVEIDLDDGVKVNYEKVQKGPDGKSLGILAKI